jgi:hypothetical protein
MLVLPLRMRCPGWASWSQACHRGESLDFLEWRSGPVNRAEDDGDDSRLIGIMPVRGDIAIVPGGDDVLTLEVSQVIFQFLA